MQLLSSILILKLKTRNCLNEAKMYLLAAAFFLFLLSSSLLWQWFYWFIVFGSVVIFQFLPSFCSFFLSGIRANSISLLKVQRLLQLGNCNMGCGLTRSHEVIKFSTVLRSKNHQGNCPANIYLFKVNSRNNRKRYCEICSKLTLKTPDRRQWRYFTLCFFFFFSLLTLNK